MIGDPIKKIMGVENISQKNISLYLFIYRNLQI